MRMAVAIKSSGRPLEHGRTATVTRRVVDLVSSWYFVEAWRLSTSHASLLAGKRGVPPVLRRMHLCSMELSCSFGGFHPRKRASYN
jgi:hypothetical protein